MIRIIIAFFILAAPAFAEGHLLPERYDVSRVASDDTLNVRAQPTTKSQVLGALAYNATGVEVTRLSEDGKWGQINFGEGAGWVGMSFMTPTGGPHWSDMTEALACFGTEPFWDLDISSRAPSNFRFFGDAAFTMTPIWESGPFGEPRTVLLRHATEMGQSSALIRAQNCNDGMSDREFGLAIDLFLEGADEYGNTHYRGCCQLQGN